MKKQYGFYVDTSLCSGCKDCAMACKDKNNLDDERFFRSITTFITGHIQEENHAFISGVAGYNVSIACNHCDTPRCVLGCPTKAMHKREDGFVVVDQSLCVGCRYCEWNCPYHAPKFDAAKGKMSKCDFCYDLLAKGQEPACVAACPLELIKFGPIEELRAKYGNNADIPGLPTSSRTHPNLIIKQHPNALKG